MGVKASFNPGSSTGSTQMVLSAANEATRLRPPDRRGNVGQPHGVAAVALAVSAALGTGGAGMPVNLSAAFNVHGIYKDGSTYTNGRLVATDLRIPITC